MVARPGLMPDQRVQMMTHELILNDDQLAVLQQTNMQPAQILCNFLLVTAPLSHHAFRF